MTLEKFTHPLIVLSAVVGLIIIFKRPSSAVSTVREFSGFDPGRWGGEGVGTISQYLAHPSFGLDPGYVHSAFRNPWQTDPSEDESVSQMVESGTGETQPSYIDYNMNAPIQSPLLNPPPTNEHGGCGGSCCGNCETKCADKCDTGVTFFDGRGSCLLPETILNIPQPYFLEETGTY